MPVLNAGFLFNTLSFSAALLRERPDVAEQLSGALMEVNRVFNNRMTDDEVLDEASLKKRSSENLFPKNEKVLRALGEKISSSPLTTIEIFTARTLPFLAHGCHDRPGIFGTHDAALICGETEDGKSFILVARRVSLPVVDPKINPHFSGNHDLRPMMLAAYVFDGAHYSLLSRNFNTPFLPVEGEHHYENQKADMLDMLKEKASPFPPLSNVSGEKVIDIAAFRAREEPGPTHPDDNGRSEIQAAALVLRL